MPAKKTNTILFWKVHIRSLWCFTTVSRGHNDFDLETFQGRELKTSYAQNKPPCKTRLSQDQRYLSDELSPLQEDLVVSFVFSRLQLWRLHHRREPLFRSKITCTISGERRVCDEKLLTEQRWRNGNICKFCFSYANPIPLHQSRLSPKCLTNDFLLARGSHCFLPLRSRSPWSILQPGPAPP